MRFIETLKNSVYGPEFYQNIASDDGRGAISYFAKLSLLVAIIMVIPTIPGILGFFSEQQLSAYASQYPTNLEIKIIDGRASINQPEPYKIPLQSTGNVKDAKGLQNLLVIDTKNEFTASLFDSYSTIALLSRDFAVMRDKNGLRMLPLNQIKNFMLNHDTIQSIQHSLLPYLIPIAICASALMVSAFFILNFARLIYFFFAALIVLGVEHLMKRFVAYKNAYRMTVYASTPGIILSTLAYIFGIQLPFLTFTFILLLTVLINRHSARLKINGSPFRTSH